jgi:xanthine dehydrogenase small subunit
VQQALLHNHASQCGFCTPGFAMSLFGLYQNQVLHGQAVSRAQAVQALSGNLCRCTGYRPILDAAQQLDQRPLVLQDETNVLQLLEHINDNSKALDANLSYKQPTDLANCWRIEQPTRKRNWSLAVPTSGCGSTKVIAIFRRCLM